MGFEMLMWVGTMWVGTTVPVMWAPFLRVAVAAQPLWRMLGGLNSKRTSVDFPSCLVADWGPLRDLGMVQVGAHSSVALCARHIAVITHASSAFRELDKCRWLFTFSS